jgi:hypothetical protein
MASPNLTREQITLVTGLVAQYINDQRSKYQPQARPLQANQREAMHGFFADELLDSVKTVVLTSERIENPSFYSMAKAMGFSDLPSFSLMAAITYSDVVVSHEPFDNDLLFHELVHVEQYHQLGIPRFAELYVRGFLNGGSYDAIPLEVNAYALDAQFANQPHEPFYVREVVNEWIREKRF